MNSKKYWEKRTAREAYEMYEDAEKVAGELKKAYSGASAYLQRQAEGLFEKFRQKYGLSDAEARRLLNSLHDSTSINELMQKLQTCEQTDGIKELRKHIEAAAYGARLRRMAGIQDSIDRLMKRLFGKTVKLASDWLQRLAGESYYKHMFELCKRTGFLLKFNGLSERAIMKLLKTKWLGGDFSSRLWENTKRLAEKLKEELLVSMLTGRTDRETANVINDEFRKGASAARRLVRTESNHVYTEARFIGTEECGIEEYIFLATLDLRTSKICRSLDGKRFKVKDRKVGTNCPPMHPWCRSTTLDYFGEEWLKNGTRSALDPVTGKRIKVPLSMTYKEWYEKYVKGHEKEIQEKENEPKNRNLTREQYDRYRRRGVGPDSYEEFIKLKGDPEAWAKLQEEYRRAGKDGKAEQTEKKAAMFEAHAAEVFVEPEKAEGDVYEDQKILRTDDKEPDNETKEKMSAPNTQRDMPQPGKLITEEELTAFVEEAQKRGYRFAGRVKGVKKTLYGGFEQYRGDPQKLYEILDTLDKTKKFWPDKLKKKGILLGYEDLGNLDDFARSSGRTMLFNKRLYDDPEFLQRAYKDAVDREIFVKGTSVSSIPLHEIGHILQKSDPFLYNRMVTAIKIYASDNNLSFEKGALTLTSLYGISKVGEEYPELFSELFSATNSSNDGISYRAYTILEEAFL